MTVNPSPVSVKREILRGQKLREQVAICQSFVYGVIYCIPDIVSVILWKL